MSIEAYPSPNGVLTSLIWRKTAAGGETSLSGYDNASQALSYTPGQEQVYLNGILLVRGSDYTATNGTSITGLTALTVDDFVQVNCYNNFSVASLPAASITGEITNSQITSLATSKLTGTVANNQLANSSITINGSAVALGGSATIAGGSAQDTAPTSPTEGQLWLDTNGTLATTAFVEKSTLTTTGDLFYASSANTPARLGIGSTGNVLTVAGGVPTWAAPAAGGKVLQVVMASSTTSTNVASTSHQDSGLSGSITPSSNTSKVLILITQSLAVYRGNNTANAGARLLRGSTEIINFDGSDQYSMQVYQEQSVGGQATMLTIPYSIVYLDSPSTTSSTTYKTQINVSSTANGQSVTAQSTGRPSTMILMEIGA